MLRTSVAGAAAMLGVPVHAQTYPSRTITLFVAFAPGGAGDIAARLVAKKLSEGLGQTVVVENRPAPVVAAVTVANAKPDGHTLFMVGSGTALTTALFKSLPYDLMRDFTHISTLASFDLALIAGANSSFQSLGDLLAYARANPGKMNIATVRVGSTQNLAAEMLKSMAGIDVLLVPYKTTSDVISALRTGDAQAAIEIVPPLLPQINAKTVKVLAVAANTRFPGMPDVPTMAESGLPGFEAASWNGLCVPVKTPPAIVARLSKEIQAAVSSPEVTKELQAIGMVAGSSTPDQMTLRLKNDIAKWKGVIEKAKIPLQ